ncbi:MAG: hypothetical protein IJ589_00170 [Lachnospiraceae bacterium]|nr:hypothetical protein [Lachnospiraceae bacterium]
MKEFIRHFRTHFVHYLIFSIVVFFVLFSHVYSDFLATQRHGITFWTALFDGHPLRFYEYCMPGGPGYHYGGGVVSQGEASCAYDFTFYLFFAIWNFPLWLIEQFFHINTQAYIPFIVWGKLMMLAALLGCGSLFVRCYHLLMEEKAHPDESQQSSLWLDDSGLYLMLISSLFFTAYSLTSANYDILNTFFMLLGLYLFMKNRRWGFIAAFAVSASLKYFGILLFVPLLLLKEKNVLKILRDTVLMLSLSVLEKIIFTTSSVSSLQETSGGYFLGLVQNASLGGTISFLGIGNVSLFFILIAGICLYAYATPKENVSAQQAVYISAACWIAFCFFIPLNPYWMVLVTPFLLLVALTGSDRPGLLLLLELIFTVTFYLAYSIKVPHVISGYNCLGMLLYYLLTVPILGGNW